MTNERGFPRSGNAGHDVQRSETELGVEAAEVVFFNPADKDAAGSGSISRTARGTAVAGQKIQRLARSPGQAEEPGRRSLIQNPSSVDPGSRSQIDDPVGGSDEVFIVFDNKDGIAFIAKFNQDFDQTGGVGRMQAGGRLIKDVEDSAKPASDLSGQADAPALPARERGGVPIDPEIAEPEAAEEIRFLEKGCPDDFPDRLFGIGEIEAAKMIGEAVNRKIAQIGDCAVPEGDPKGFGP